jgi:Flp pilus assembly secretin CpaC
VPVAKADAKGALSVEYRTVGTKLDAVQTVLDGDRLRLELRLTHTDVEPGDTANSTNGPTFRTRAVDTAVELADGQAVVLCGLGQNSRDAASTAEKAASSKAGQQGSELVVLVKPEIVRGAASQAYRVKRATPR